MAEFIAFVSSGVALNWLGTILALITLLLALQNGLYRIAWHFERTTYAPPVSPVIDGKRPRSWLKQQTIDMSRKLVEKIGPPWPHPLEAK